MKKIILFYACLVWLVITSGAQTVTDYDGNIYDTVMIGNQAWLKENLKVTHYRNGVPIPNVAGGAAWAGMTSGARCYYANDSTTYDSVYGPLYNWFAVNNAYGICPSGWHVPSDAEWTATEMFLGGSFIAGGKMKEAGTFHWLTPNTGATNSSGFTGLPGGMLSTSFTFQTMAENGLWWTSTLQSPSAVWSRYLWYLFAGVDRNPTPKMIGLSIRCIKDVGVDIGDLNNHRILLYPNPAQRRIFISCGGHQDLLLYIYNLSGKIILKSLLTENKNEVDIGSLTNGFYFVEIKGDSWTIREKFMKE